jgi:ATP-binding protein involved in chromosome partitioning
MSLLVRSTELHDDVVVAVGAVTHPGIDVPLATLGLLDSVDVSRGGDVTVRILVLTEHDTRTEALVSAVDAATRSVPGVRRSIVRTAVLDDQGRGSLSSRLRGRHRRPGRMGSPTKVYAIASGKGGVGKSTLTANLAVALAQDGQRVGVLDADVWGYSVPQLFGIREHPVAIKGLMLPVESHGVRLMSIGFFVSEDEPVVWRGPMLHKALEQLLDDVFWGSLDVLLVDLPPGTGDVPLTVLELLPDANLVVVTTPQRAAEVVAARVGKMAAEAGMPVVGVVENMVGAAFGVGGGARLAGSLGIPLLAQVPVDEALSRAGDDGVPLVVADPENPTARLLAQVSANLPAVRRSLVGRSLPLSVT